MGMAVIRLISGAAKSIKQTRSNSNIFKVLTDLKVIKLIVKPMIPKKAKNWSGLPKSNNANNSQTRNGRPIILPVRIINE